MPYASSYAAPRRSAKRKAKPKRKARAARRAPARRKASTPRRSKAKPKPKAKRRSSSRARVTYVYRYNPASTTGRAVRVRSDSPEAAEWPSRKPKRMSATTRRALTSTTEHIVKAALPALAIPAAKVSARVAAAAAPALATAGELGAAATGGLVAVAFGAGYAIGTALRALWNRMQPEERNYRKALAFRKAREQFARDHGREMTPDEVRAMGKGFLQSLSPT